LREAGLVRARLIIVLSVIVVLLVGAAAFIALWGDGPTRPGVVTVNVAHLPPGHAQAVTVQLPDKKQPTARIFLVRRRSHGIDAFLGVSTHLGCRLLLPGDPHYGNGFTVTRQLAFEDPCGGSVFALNGECVGGPCPRGLDRYSLKVRDETVEVDLNHLIKGPPRGS
jgi:nitrite reductase/ring-hydroxylating ferredoxin subunit